MAFFGLAFAFAWLCYLAYAAVTNHPLAGMIWIVAATVAVAFYFEKASFTGQLERQLDEIREFELEQERAFNRAIEGGDVLDLANEIEDLVIRARAQFPLSDEEVAAALRLAGDLVMRDEDEEDEQQWRF